MKFLDLGTLASVASGTGILTQGLGLLPGDTAIGKIFSPGGAFAGSAQIQTSPDNSTWTNVGVAVTAGYDEFTFKLDNYVRLNCTSRSAGSVKGAVLNDVS